VVRDALGRIGMNPGAAGRGGSISRRASRG
jgi:hypothetical protein